MSLIDELKSKLDQFSKWENDVTLKRNEFLVHSGQRNSKLYCVCQGALRVYFEEESDEYTIGLAYKNNFLLALETKLE